MSYVMEWVLILAEALLTVLMLATMLNLANAGSLWAFCYVPVVTAGIVATAYMLKTTIRDMVRDRKGPSTYAHTVGYWD